MALETGSYIGDLVTTNPTSTDPKNAGDDHLRLIKTALAGSFSGWTGLVLIRGTEAQGATVNDYVVTITPAPAAYTIGIMVFKATHTNTGACTLKINSLAAKTLKDVDGGAIESGDIVNGAACIVYYDGTDFFLLSGNDKVSRAGDTYTGTHDFTGATISSTQLDAKAPLASPTFTGTPLAPTAVLGTSTTQLATTAFVATTAFSSALPAQSGNNGKYVTTDGTNASWGTIDVTTTHLFNITTGIL